MYKGERPKVFPIIVTILVISLVVAAVASVIRMVATRQESNNTNTQQSTESFYDQVVAHNDQQCALDGARADCGRRDLPLVPDRDFAQ